ncbi:hypothetical protein PJ985_19590 [Streptomyces sp. ACA25]|uniref:hypothetical protein n=1 Tax=Streptomyces sp. ACA25 TaxID=3022596 RepID=UPI0023077FF2|nr:hypothetical protein [Streptomyces sp. ACA25]MDB1089762.1 hypothetical protein [Streptomyces sp. ACA25]
MRHAAAAAVLAVVLLSACAPGGGQEDPQPPGDREQAPSARENAEPSADPGAAPEPRRTPGGSAEALELARAVSAAPGDFGDDFVPQEPYESDPAQWAVLDEECVWRREPLPEPVLAALTRHAERPAENPEAGPLQVMSSVTVHDSDRSADARMAGTLEEVLRCPEQRLRPDERVHGLESAGSPGDRERLRADDHVHEVGLFVSDTHGGPHPYLWMVSRVGPVTVALSVKGSAEYADQEELREIAAPVLTRLQAGIEEALR